MLSTVALSLQAFDRAHAVGGLSAPQGLPLVDPGATITVDVSVSGMDFFNGWDIAIWSNTTSLNATAIDTSTDDVFGAGYQILPGTLCINDAGSHCNADDGPGIAHLAAAVFPAPPASSAPFTGVLFSIKYKAGAYTYSPLQFKLSRIINGGCTGCQDVDHTTDDGSYGTTTAPNISFTIDNQFPSVTEGQAINTTLTVSSINNFSGQVELAFEADSIARGIQVTFSTTSIFLNNSTASVNVTISTSPTATVRGYSLKITATGPRVFQDLLVGLNVQAPGDFNVAINPGLLKVPQNSTTSAIVTISSQTRQYTSQEFSGNVTLSVVAKNATATLDQTLFYVRPGQTVAATLTVWVPESFYGFTYLVNVTGVWVENHDVNYTATVVVTHLPSDLAPSVGPSTLTVRAGHSASATFLVASSNYFVGYVFPSSTMSGGTARFNESSSRLDVGRTIAISVNVTVDPSTVPGNYIVLLTATGQQASGAVVARTAAENIVVEPNGHPASQIPTTIFGLPVTVYWGVLGGFAAVFVLLSALTFRRSRSDKDEWE
jgi:hypothetical protein